MMYERVEWRSIVGWKIRITRIDETESEWGLKNAVSKIISKIVAQFNSVNPFQYP